MLIVIGSGLAGSWLTRVARDRGVEVTLIGDEREPPTYAAVGLLRSSHLPDADRELLPRSVRLWSEHGIAVHYGAQVTRWDKPGRRVYQPDWYVVDPSRACLEPDIVGCARPLGPGRVGVGSTVLTGPVVWCDGAGSGKRTYGVTWRHADPRALRHPLAVHHVGPYRILAGASFPTGCRLGSSSAADPFTAMADGPKNLVLAVEIGMTESDEGWTLISGTRLQRAVTLTRDGPDGAWRWSGFHRTGFGVVPASAASVLKRVLT